MLDEYISQISELFHGEFISFWYTEINKKHKDTWVRLFAAKDLMRDNIEALQHNIDQCAGTILGVYGFMQALYLQQNALMNIYECIKGEKLDLNSFEGMRKARKIRNDEIGGHPVSHKEQRYNVLAPHLINGWKITICDHAKGLAENAVVTHDLLEIRDKQEQEIAEVMAGLLAFCQIKLKAHKEKFMHTKLSDLFKGLCLSRIMQAISDPTNDNLHLAKTECRFLKEQAKKFLDLVAERGEEPGNFEKEIAEFLWGLENITQYFQGSQEDKLHAHLLWRGLDSLFANLKDYAREIDTRYSDF